jgi:hypothetical protein
VPRNSSHQQLKILENEVKIQAINAPIPSREELESYYIDFEEAMGKGTGYFRQVEKYTGKSREYFNFFKELYEKNNFLKIQPQTTPKIPKIIHQIWIGKRQLPAILQEYQQTWKQLNPSWEYQLWTNEDVKNYTFVNKDLKLLFDQRLTLGERVDVLRYDILYQHGGVYADCDCICLKPLDIFAHSYDFFAGILQPTFATMEQAIFLQNCLVGTKPGHPVVKKLSSLLLENWNDIEYEGDEVYTTLKRTFATLTEALVSEGNKGSNIDIAMPPSYFFPIVPYVVVDLAIRGIPETILGFFDKRLDPYSSIKKYSFAHHYSRKDWVSDIYSTMTFNHPGWVFFTFKDWWLFLKAKLWQQKTQKKIARQTFEELIS